MGSWSKSNAHCSAPGPMTTCKNSFLMHAIHRCFMYRLPLPRGDCCYNRSYMNDTKGLHTITNPSSTEVAVSLHIYSPPFRECNIFQPISGEPKTVSMVPSGTPNFKDQGWLSCDTNSADEHNPLFKPPLLRGEPLCDDAPNSSLGDLTIQDFINALQEVGFQICEMN